MKTSASSTLCCLPPELLTRIAFFAVASDHCGPPRAVAALLLTCRRNYTALNFYGNKALWAQVFRLKFDVAAPTRRLGARATLSVSLATESKKRFQALHRIRMGVIFGPHLLADLWTAFLMMLENDGRNEVQLLDWAELPKFLNALISFNGSATTLWSRDPTQLSILVWLMWFTSTAGVICNESPEEAKATSLFLHPLIENARDFSNFHGPDDRFRVSLPRSSDFRVDSQSPTAFAIFNHTFSPDQRYITHYGHPMTVAVPPVTSAAFLAFTARQRQCISNASNVILRDEEEFTAPTYLRLPTRNEEGTSAHSGSPFDTSTSERYDPDWSRLTSCINPIGLGRQHWQMDGANAAAPGRWTGVWVGQFLAPYRGILSDPQGILRVENPQDLAMASSTLCCRLREYHCLSSEVPVASGEDVGESDQITNCWLPRGTEPQETKGKNVMDIYDPTTRRSSRYYSPGPGDDGTYPGIGQKDAYRNQDAESPSEKHNANGEVGIESNEDGRCHRAIRDILVTGSIEQRQGDNWLDWAVIGRVRLWDGLLVLRRKPPPNQEHLGNGIFRGYLTASGQIVGRWRNGWASGEAPQLEGPFVIAKIKD
ncbi:hypothetical protein BD410DRAFT_837287 [Rickenella mellea]|uniref:F-box domain-containing protein n=1 Tax=Rickenella mellea TaxID=50990 RepID=A0A4Y7QFG4_9AGAM|nr:hypothetical protein BD410DRAFT_837287 [Rickenella mellea]